MNLDEIEERVDALQGTVPDPKELIELHEHLRAHVMSMGTVTAVAAEAERIRDLSDRLLNEAFGIGGKP